MSNLPKCSTGTMRTESPVKSRNSLLHINDPNQQRKTEKETTQRGWKGPLPAQAHTQTRCKHTQASPWNMTVLRWRRWGWVKPYCNNLILWSLIVSCCYRLPNRVHWAYVKHISPLSVGALPASSSAAQRRKPWELLKADRPDNLPLGLQRQIQSLP